MGVTGLWRLIEPSGKPVPVETLENKVLAVDISIWLHQMVKGYQDTKGAPVANAHLIGLFQRLCKLLYFRIKPIFVFDGAFPELKKETIAKRQDNKSKYNSESERLKRELALLLRKKTAVNSLLGKQISPKKTTPLDNDDLFKLPPLPQKDQQSESESEDESNTSGSSVDLHTIDVESEKFKNLPIKEKYDLLMELKETRKQNSWGRLHELPKNSDTFSDFQLQRLLKRRKVQECLEETEKEMGDTGMSIIELESLLNEEGIDTKIEAIATKRIASDENQRYLLINNVKQAMAEAKKKKEQEILLEKKLEENNIEKTSIVEVKPKADEFEDDLQKAIKMSMECITGPDTSASTSKTDDSWTSCLSDTDYSYEDSEEDISFEQPDMSTAKNYIMQYTGFTEKAINKIVSKNAKPDKSKQSISNIHSVLNEINQENFFTGDIEDYKKYGNTQNTNDKQATENESTNKVEDIDVTQSSIVCLGNPIEKVITLDTTLEENSSDDENVIKDQGLAMRCEDNIVKTKELLSVTDKSLNIISLDTLGENKTKNRGPKEDSDSSDADFEDVIDNDPFKAVVELTLNMGNVPEDDIFADIFIHDKEFSKSTVDKTVETAPPMITKNVSDIEQGLSHKTVVVKEVKHFNCPNNSETEILVNNVCENQVDEIPIISIKIDEMNDNPPNKNIEVVTSNPPKEINTKILNTIAGEIDTQEQNLLQEKGRLDRVGRNITEQMTKEAQELLQIFGIPYIVAPMEAEAQCAFLENIKLTDGTITDDSDIWLFGGKTVYKNFFNNSKHVLQFLSERIEKSFNLSREKLILLALLVGSDYTTGITGVGPVTALEILASFPFNKNKTMSETSKQLKYAQILAGMQEFKKWVRAGKRTDNISLKKKLKNVNLSDDFPSIRVVQAYLDPNIEKSEDKFSWGELDITILRDYTKAKFGWSQSKLDEIIQPIIKRRQERKNQKTVEDYFKKKVDFQSLENQMSKRVIAAVRKMNPDLANTDNDRVLENSKKKRPANRKESSKAGPSTSKRRKVSDDDTVLNKCGVKVVSEIKDGKSVINIKIPKTDRYQDYIPQREKHKQMLLENKLKAIEIFRKTKIDPKKKNIKRKVPQPKEEAELSESD